MGIPIQRRSLWTLWLAGLGLLVALSLMPVSYRITRAAGLALMLAVWFGAWGLLWNWRVWRAAHLSVTILLAVFLGMPGNGTVSPNVLRADYMEHLRRYEGVKYVWGGENARGIDCSGLMRRGLINAMLARSVRDLDGALARRALVLWWNDTTAKVLGEANDGRTIPVLVTPNLDSLDHASIRKGDLAVTSNGLHVMAYLGDRCWIEADPGEGRVIVLKAGESASPWLRSPMRIARWKILQ